MDCNPCSKTTGGYGWIGLIFAVFIIIIIVAIIAMVFGGGSTVATGATGTITITDDGGASGGSVTYGDGPPSGSGTGQIGRCAQFLPVPCVEPEPYASSIDFISGSQALEKAIHAPCKADMLSSLADVTTFLTWALGYFKQANNARMIARTQEVINQFDKIYRQGQAIRKDDLHTFQNNVLYSSVGMIASLQRSVNNGPSY